MSKLFKSEYFQVEVTESPSYIDKASTIFYKYNIGPYSNVSSLMLDAAKMGEGKGRPFGIYYSNPQVSRETIHFVFTSFQPF